MKLTRRAALAALFAVLALPAGAYVVGGTNFGIMGYPLPTCRAPAMVPRDDDFSRRMNQTERERYAKCIDDYVANGNNDIKRIHEAQQQAVKDAERALSL